MFCNLSRPVSTWIYRIVLELYTVSLPAADCSFTTDESCRFPRCWWSRTSRWFLWYLTLPAAFSEALNAWLNVTTCYLSLPNATLFLDKLKWSQNVSQVFFTGQACFVFLFFFLCMIARQYPKSSTSFINIIFRHVIIVMEALSGGRTQSPALWLQWRRKLPG